MCVLPSVTVDDKIGGSGEMTRDWGNNAKEIFGRSEGIFAGSDWRAHWAWRALALAFLALALLPSSAYAYPAGGEQVILRDQIVTVSGESEPYVGTMILAYSSYRAALLTLGVSPSDVRLTDSVRAKLSNAASGGDFYLFAQTFLTREQRGGVLPSYAFGASDFVEIWETTAGSGDVGPYLDIFYSVAEQGLQGRAMLSLQRVLDGGSNAPAGTTYVGLLDTITFTMADFVGDNAHKVYWDGSADNPLDATIKVDMTAINAFLREIASNSRYKHIYYTAWVNEAMSATKLVAMNLYMTSGSATISVGNSISFTAPYYELQCDIVNTDASLRGISNGKVNIMRAQVRSGIQYPHGVEVNNGSDSFSLRRPVYLLSSDNHTSTPPDNWPTSPGGNGEPTKPTVPDPPSGGGGEPQPSAPAYPVAPSLPSLTIVSGPSYQVADLSAVLDAMDEHCQHLQEAIRDGFAGYYASMTVYLGSQMSALASLMRGQFGWAVGQIDIMLSDLCEYMRDLAEWLASQFDYSVSGGGYDDGTVVAWLKRIYLKLGTGSVSTKPSDPTADPAGFGDWLQRLIDNFVQSLIDLGGEGVADVLDILEELKNRFPFSIPWDIAVILAMMVAEPVAPVFDAPLYSWDGTQVVRAGSAHVDLSEWGTALGGIRFMQVVLFTAYLLAHTKGYMDMLKASSGG